MSNFALSFASTAYAITPQTGQLPIENATAIGITARIRGDRLIDPTTLSDAAAFMEVAAGKLRALIYDDTAGGVALALTAAGINNISTPIVSSSFAKSSLSSSAYYRLKFWWDTANASKQGLELYNDAGTSLIASTGSNTTALGVFAGFGDVAINYDGAGTPGGPPCVFDWLGIYSAAPPAGSPAEPTNADANLLERWAFNEGSGTTATGAPNGYVATVSGTATWISLGGVLLPPPQGRGGSYQ